jgi:hypothetical protein
MWATSEVLRLGATAVVGLLAGVLLRSHTRNASARAFVLLLSTVAAHLVFPLLLRRGTPAPILHPVLLLGMAVPLCFWLTAEVHLDDDFRLRPTHLLIATAFLALGYVSWLGASSIGCRESSSPWNTSGSGRCCPGSSGWRSSSMPSSGSTWERVPTSLTLARIVSAGYGTPYPSR